MHKVYLKSSNCLLKSKYITNIFIGGNNVGEKPFHVSLTRRFPQVALALPTNVVDINAAEIGRFSPMRERDISGPVINSLYEKHHDSFGKIDITVQSDPHVNKYDCRGAVSLSSSMQSNVPSPFSSNHTHLGMPGSQWGQGYKYLSDHLHGAHYLTLRNEYRENLFNKVVTVGIRKMSLGTQPKLSAKEKLKNAVKEYGSTVIIFHVTISVLSLGCCYLLVSSGVDLVAVLQKMNVGEGILAKVASSNAGNFVIAYAVHKVFAPVRIGMTLTATPFIVKYLRKIGILSKTKKEHSGGGI